MATGRIYRLRKKQIEYFYPQEYNDAAGNLDYNKTIAGIVNVLVPGIGGPKILDVYFDKGYTSSSAIVTDVLKQNGITPASVAERSKKRVRYTFKSKQDRDTASNIISRMNGDKIVLSEIDYTTTPPTVKTKSGLDLELDGWSKPKSEDPEYNSSAYGKIASGEDLGDSGTLETGINWYLIGGAALVGVILVIAIVKLMKKK